MTDIDEFIKLLPKNRPIVGLDLGTKTIGVSLSDRLHLIATPSHVIKRTKFTVDAESLWQLIQAENVGAVVIGLPQNLDGTNGPRVQASKGFAYNLKNIWKNNCPPILLWDERLSTVEAERAMISADMSRAKRAEKIDAVAAAIILQGALDRIRIIDAGV